MDDSAVLIEDIHHLGAFVYVKRVEIQPIFGEEIGVDVAECAILGIRIFAINEES